VVGVRVRGLFSGSVAVVASMVIVVADVVHFGDVAMKKRCREAAC
jgi:hypothetical protein